MGRILDLETEAQTMKKAFSSVVALLCLASVAVASDEYIDSVQIKTADCLNCGMNGLFGQVSLKVCGAYGNCCNTGQLDNVGEDDFNRNTISSFDFERLGGCKGFDLAGQTPASMTLFHTGSDGWKPDFVAVLTTHGFYKCQFSKTLDGTDKEVGHACAFKPYL